MGLDALLFVVGATAVAGVSRRLRLSAPLMLVLTGLVVSFIPGIPDFTLEPELVLVGFLPPLLYSAALESSYVSIRQNLRPIGLLSIGLVLFSTVVTGLVMHALIPGMPLAAAFAFGAIVAPPDAVAATAIGRRLGLPRRIVTILGGESLVNDATALTAYRVAVGAATGAGFSFLHGAGVFTVASVGGVAIGLAFGVGVQWLTVRLRDPVLESTCGLVAPWLAYLVSEHVHASGVLSVVIAGLYVGHLLPKATYASRLQGGAVWKVVDFVLETVVFALIGLQLPAVLQDLQEYGRWELASYGLAAFVCVILVRIVWVFPATYLPRRLSRRLRDRDPSPPWTYPAVISWAGMRGVVSLAAAFALPEEFPRRDLILLLTFLVVVGTLVVQGFTLPWLIRRLGVRAQTGQQDVLAEAEAQHHAVNAALTRLDELLGEADEPLHEPVVDALRRLMQYRANAVWERLGSAERETPAQIYRRLRREMLEAEREVFVQLRNEGKLADEIMRRVLLELDFEEATLARE